MADNDTVKDSGGNAVTIANDDIGGVKYPRFKVDWGPDGSANDVDVASGKPLPIQLRSATGLIPFGEPTDAKSTATDTTSAGLIALMKSLVDSGRFIVAAGSAVITRPANTTAYTAGDAVSNNATAGSVTSGTFTLASVNDAPITIEEILCLSTDTGLGSKNMRLWLFNSDPTASSGVGGGDNAAFSQKQAGFIGTMVAMFMSGVSDGAVGRFVPEYGSRVITTPVSGAKTIFFLLQTVDAFTPSANSTTLTFTAKGFQGHI